MKLYLMRHGEALHPAVDPKMGLSPRGQQDVSKMAEYLKNSGQKIDAVWHSPKTRALETAQRVAEGLGLDAAVLQQQQELVPEGDVPRTKERINKARQEGHFKGLLIVSHMPFLPQLTLSLAEDSGQTDFETASTACFFFSGGVWTREWLKDAYRL